MLLELRLLSRCVVAIPHAASYLEKPSSSTAQSIQVSVSIDYITKTMISANYKCDGVVKLENAEKCAIM